MKYDETRLPEGYDRARSRPPEVLEEWMAAVRAHGPAGLRSGLVLDLGCGTGRFSAALRAAVPAPVLGLDPSDRMIRQAAEKHAPGVRFVAGAAEAIPLADGVVDLAFASMVLHHLIDTPAALSELARVLTPAGAVFVRNGTRDRIGAYPAAQFFPSSVPIFRRTLPTGREIRAVFEAAGFRTRHVGCVRQEAARTHAELADRFAAGGDSVLAQLDPADFQLGLERLRARAVEVDPRPAYEPIDLLVFERG